MTLSLLVVAAASGSLPSSQGQSDPGFSLLSLAREGRFAIGGAGTGEGLSFSGEPRLQDVELDSERRPAVVLPLGAWRWKGEVPEGGELRLGAGIVSVEDAELAPEVVVSALVRVGGTRDVAAVERLEAGRWRDFGIDLARWTGRRVVVEVSARGSDAAQGDSSGARIAWTSTAVVSPSLGAETERPNVLVILIDTLRRDRLSCYGYERQTSPRIDALLAAKGVRVEDAYSQAPWTVPSMVSMFTGRYPGEVLRGEIAAYSVPESLRALPERFTELGYATAAFYANPILHQGNGFARGFETVFSPPVDEMWFERHAEDLNRRLEPWLAANRDRPFFVWAHYADPHDPYINPDLVAGNSPYYPDYDGPLTGRHVHGVYQGIHRLQRPLEDIAHLSALYDSEVSYVDRFVGRLLESLPEPVLANTVVVLTSDHGEELYDHGGWKHGQTLYQEQIHVPLLFRWDGRLAPGTTLEGTVELVDLMPTLLAAAGAPEDPGAAGIDLLPALRGDASLPRRPAYAQHMQVGPMRAAAVLDGRKLIHFDKQAPYEPESRMDRYLWQRDFLRLAEVEVYDLRGDPAERRNLAADGERSAVEAAPALAEILRYQLEAQAAALADLAEGTAEGAEGREGADGATEEARRRLQALGYLGP